MIAITAQSICDINIKSSPLNRLKEKEGKKILTLYILTLYVL